MYLANFMLCFVKAIDHQHMYCILGLNQQKGFELLRMRHSLQKKRKKKAERKFLERALVSVFSASHIGPSVDWAD